MLFAFGALIFFLFLGLCSAVSHAEGVLDQERKNKRLEKEDRDNS